MEEAVIDSSMSFSNAQPRASPAGTPSSQDKNPSRLKNVAVTHRISREIAWNLIFHGGRGGWTRRGSGPRGIVRGDE